jgi:tetratricopeptide (TPR) repeat protein/DNA-binding CsgD family transcriptional regulator
MLFVMALTILTAQSPDANVVAELDDLIEAMNGNGPVAMEAAGERMMKNASESGRCAPYAAGVYALSRVAISQGDYERAHALFEERTDCLRMLPQLEFQRAVLAFSEGRYGEARAIWKSVVENTENELLKAKSVENMGACWQREGQLDSAQLHYSRALELQGDRVNLMTVNNIVSILNLTARYDEVRTFFAVGMSLESEDSTALDMLFWNLIQSEVMQGNDVAATEAMREREERGFVGVPDYAIYAYWNFLLFMDDYDAFSAHRAKFSADELAQMLDGSPVHIKDLFDDGRDSEFGRLPLSVKWVIARRGLELARELESSMTNSRPVSMLQSKLEEKLTQEQRWNDLLMASLVGCVMLVGGVWVFSILARGRRRGAAERMEFSNADHKSVQAIREALVKQSGGEEALLHLAELRELLEARQTNSLSRIMGEVDLTPTELKLLQLIGKSYNAGECAKMLNCTKSHVYNLRSSVRKKLDLPETISLKTWVVENMGR